MLKITVESDYESKDKTIWSTTDEGMGGESTASDFIRVIYNMMRAVGYSEVSIRDAMESMAKEIEYEESGVTTADDDTL